MRHFKPIALLFSLVCLAGLFFCDTCPRADAQSPVIGPTIVHLLSYHATQTGDVSLTQGDTGPAVDALLESSTGAPVNLTGASVSLIADAATGTTDAINSPCQVINPETGEVKYLWQSSDTAAPGTFTLTFRVTMADGTQVTFPSDHSLRLVISPVAHYSPAVSQMAVQPVGTIGSDGAFGTNAQYEAGTYAYWYPELQRYGTDYIEQGIDQENPALISQGLTMLDWAFAKMGTDGSFPGAGSSTLTSTNAQSVTGGRFHTVSLFFEAANRAVIDLRGYAPTTYALDPSTYTSKIAGYQASLATIAAWLTNTSWTPATGGPAVNVPVLGQAFDLPYSHRFPLLAAGLEECSVVTGNQTLITQPYGANWWIDQLFPRQLGAGWTAAYNPAAVTPAAAILIPPGGSVPAGYTQISAQGVLPERNGFDASYGQVDALHQTRLFNNSTDSIRRNEIVQCLIGQLSFERSLQSTSGVINTAGSSRVGIDQTLTNSAQQKGLSTSEVMQAFLIGGVIDKKGRDVLAGIRFRDSTVLPNNDVVNSDGSIGSNTPSAYNISLQKDGADWIQAGILHENDSQIAQGESILAWGLARQAGDGSFPLTGSPYTDTAYFIEAAARSVLMLQGYHPISHPLNTSLLTCIPSFLTALSAASGYLVANASGGFASTTSASRIATYAAALSESAQVLASGYPATSSAAQSQSNTFLASFLALQLTDGTDPESGAFAGNSQATSSLMSARLATYGTFTTPSKAALTASLVKSLTKMESVINPDGSFTYSSPAVQTTANAFQLGQTVTGVPGFGVFCHRLTDMSLPGQ